MSLTLNNSKDVTCDSLFLLYNNSSTNALDVISASSGSGNEITAITGSGAAVVMGSGASRNVFVDLSGYTNTSALILILNGKENTITAGSFLTKTGSTLNVDLSAYTNTTGLTTLLNAKENTITAGTFSTKSGSTLNVDLTAYTNTTGLTTLLNTKQNNITTTTNLSMQDLTCRFLTGGNASSAFTITGNSLITFKDSSNNTLMSSENAVVTLPKPITCKNNTEFRKNNHY